MPQIAEGRTAKRRPKRSKRGYTAPGDSGILKAIAKFQFLTVKQTAEETNRNPIGIGGRLQELYLDRILGRSRRDKLAPYIYFLAEKGAQKAVSLGYLPEPRWIKSKSSLLVNHDLELTVFHRTLEQALLKAGHALTFWEQWRWELRDDVETADGREAIIPDAMLAIDDKDTYFLEIVKSYESEYENGESNLVRKIRLYSQYKTQFRKTWGVDDFRVIFVLPTPERVLQLLVRLEDEFPYRRFWMTDEESYKRDILGKIFWTPRDFRGHVYSLLETEK